MARAGFDPAARRDLFASCNAWWDRERLYAGGAAYHAELTDGSLEYVPILGAKAPRTMPWRFSFAGMQRGAVRLAGPGEQLLIDGKPRLIPDPDGRCSIRVPRGPGITEVFRIRPDGVEITYELAGRPAGAGDLVVRGAVATELVGRMDRGRGLVFGLPDPIDGAGDVLWVGGVTGVDAAGWHVPGTLDFRDGELVMTLPGSFLDRASYPVVLDPLVGSTRDLTTVATDESEPDAAYGLNADSLLVVYRRNLSSTAAVIRAQRFNQTSGSPNGGLIGISPSISGYDTQPAVGYLASEARYIVAWCARAGFLDTGAIEARAVDPLTGQVSPSVTVVTAAASDARAPDISSEIRSGGVGVACIWLREGTGIRAATLGISAATGDVTSGGVLTVANDGFALRPRIARSGGATGRSCFVFESQVALQRSVLAGVLANGTLLYPAQAIATSGSRTNPDVDGDGTQWLMVYEAPISQGRTAVRCRNAAVLGSFFVTGSQESSLADNGFGESFHAPSIAWLGGKYGVAWEREDGLFGSFLARSLQVRAISSSCEPCGATYSVPGGGARNQQAVLVGRASGSLSPSGEDIATLVFTGSETAPPYDSGVHVARFRGTSDGVPLQNLGGGCGGGGAIGQTGGPTVLRNSASTVTLTGADPAANFAFLWVALPGPLVPCSTCSGVNPTSLVATYSMPVVGGAASQSAPIPCAPGVIGLQLDFQWIVFNTSSNPCFFAQGLAVSDVLRATITD